MAFKLFTSWNECKKSAKPRKTEHAPLTFDVLEDRQMMSATTLATALKCLDNALYASAQAGSYKAATAAVAKFSETVKYSFGSGSWCAPTSASRYNGGGNWGHGSSCSSAYNSCSSSCSSDKGSYGSGSSCSSSKYSCSVSHSASCSYGKGSYGSSCSSNYNSCSRSHSASCGSGKGGWWSGSSCSSSYNSCSGSWGSGHSNGSCSSGNGSHGYGSSCSHASYNSCSRSWGHGSGSSNGSCSSSHKQNVRESVKYANRFVETGIAAEPGAKVPPINKIEGVQAKQSVFSAASAKKPLVLRTAEDAGKHFDEANLKKLAEKVDFTQQVVLVFAWRGSGQDKLESTVAESCPEQIRFRLLHGRTRDLRQHVEVHALRSNVKWTVR